MRCVQSLPEGYREIRRVNLQKDKKTALLVNGAALLIALALILPAAFLKPIYHGETLPEAALKLGVISGAMLVYIVLHELTHGVCMRCLGAKVKYGFTLLYAYAGSDACFDKGAYLLIALAPVVVWGAVLTVVTALVPPEWVWVAYAVQVMNLSGAAGDLYVTALFSRLPGDILVQDSGVEMVVYQSEK